MNKKKIAFTIIVAVIALSALCWVFWLVFYFDSTIDGSIVVNLTNEYIIFERNYLVPLQIFGITIALTIFTFIFYLKLKKKKRKCRILLIPCILPFWYLFVCHLNSIITYYDVIYV